MGGKCSGPHAPDKRLARKYWRIGNDYKSLEQVTSALTKAGLESSNLIVGIDFTKSNEWKASTHDQSVFGFNPDMSFCQGFEDVLRRYREIVPQLQLSGPTSFAPIIEMGMKIVEESGGQYHILLIIADGQVTRSGNTKRGQLSAQEKSTIDAIVKASKYPLSIVLVGVGDGPWNMMKQFDDNIPSRAFDNFQFVNFTKIMSKDMNLQEKQTQFALTALMEIPLQYKATLKLGLLGARTGCAPNVVPLPPPSLWGATSQFMSPSAPPPSLWGATSQFMSPSAPEYRGNEMYGNKVCPVCLVNPKDMAFDCGHQTCNNCGFNLMLCPICRNLIKTKIRLFE
ncbi:E3 ubiquitin protein ligase RGLG2-like protein [Tanacetum coccineum]